MIRSALQSACMLRPASLLALLVVLAICPVVSAGTVLSPAPGTASYSLLPNGGFEAGLVGTWDQSVNAGFGVFSRTDAKAWSGDYSVVTNTYSYTMEAGYARSTYPQYIPVTPGETYVLSGFLNTLGLTSGNFYLDLWDEAFEPTVGVADEPALLGRDWFFVWGEFTVPAGVTSVLVRVVRDKERYTTDVGYADEIGITPKDEFRAPTSASPVPVPAAAWLGLGMLALLGAARRVGGRRLVRARTE